MSSSKGTARLLRPCDVAVKEAWTPVDLTLSPARGRAWSGEVFVLSRTLHPSRRNLVSQRSRSRWTPKPRATRRLGYQISHGRSTDPRPFLELVIDPKLDSRSIVPKLWRDVCFCASLHRERRRTVKWLYIHITILSHTSWRFCVRPPQHHACASPWPMDSVSASPMGVHPDRDHHSVVHCLCRSWGVRR